MRELYLWSWIVVNGRVCIVLAMLLRICTFRLDKRWCFFSCFFNGSFVLIFLNLDKHGNFTDTFRFFEVTNMTSHQGLMFLPDHSFVISDICSHSIDLLHKVDDEWFRFFLGQKAVLIQIVLLKDSMNSLNYFLFFFSCWYWRITGKFGKNSLLFSLQGFSHFFMVIFVVVFTALHHILDLIITYSQPCLN